MIEWVSEVPDGGDGWIHELRIPDVVIVGFCDSNAGRSCLGEGSDEVIGEAFQDLGIEVECDGTCPRERQIVDEMESLWSSRLKRLRRTGTGCRIWRRCAVLDR